MGLLDFDDSYKPPFQPSRELVRKAVEQPRDNFHALQNLGHREMSEDYTDSKYADRKETGEMDAE